MRRIRRSIFLVIIAAVFIITIGITSKYVVAAFIKSIYTPVREREDYYENSFFMCRTTSDSTATLIGFTEAGLNEEEIIVPTKLGDYDIRNIRGRYFGWKRFQKLFIPGRNYSFSNSYEDFPWPEKKIIFLSANPLNYRIGFSERFSCAPYAMVELATIYVAQDSFNKFKEEYKRGRFFPANVSYFYNFEDAPNDGYYWVDDLDEGQSLKTIPPNPTREGFAFDGWFTDLSCSNAFDFDSYIKDEHDLLLYAKWSV